VPQLGIMHWGREWIDTRLGHGTKQHSKRNQSHLSGERELVDMRKVFVSSDICACPQTHVYILFTYTSELQ